MIAAVFNLRIPSWEWWAPLIVGMGVGGLSILIVRRFFQRAALVPPPQPQLKETQEYDPFVMGSPTEQRKTHRRGGNPVEIQIAPDQCNNAVWQGWVLDRSLGGLCISMNVEIKPGTILRVLPASAPPMTPWTEIEIRSCRPVNEGFELGCQFLKTPTWAVMLLFG